MELTEQDIHQKQEEPVHRDLTGVNVLMAEDNDLNAELATVMLEDAGMVVTRASDGKEAVERFKIIREALTILFDGYYDAEHGRTSGCENDPGHGEGTTGRKFDSDYCLVRKCVCGGCQGFRGFWYEWTYFKTI